VLRRLEGGTPAVYPDPIGVLEGRLLFAPACLKEGEPAVIARQIRAALQPPGRGEGA
jgi:hypothetical protein